MHASRGVLFFLVSHKECETIAGPGKSGLGRGRAEDLFWAASNERFAFPPDPRKPARQFALKKRLGTVGEPIPRHNTALHPQSPANRDG